MALPTGLALAGLTVAVLAKDLIGYTDLVVNRGLGPGAVALIAFYQSVPLATAMLPFAVLLGCLAGLGRLGADRELLALEACGVAPAALARPVLAFAAAASVPAFLLSLFVAPWSQRSLDASLRELAQSHPAAVIRAGVVQSFGDWRLEAREANAAGDRMRGVLLWVPDVGRTVFAERGRISADPDGATRVTLERGSMLFASGSAAREIRFERMATRLPEAEEPLAAEVSDTLDGASLRELVALARAGAAPDDRGHRARVALHRRLALPTATLLFGWMALPIAIRLRTHSRSAGAVAGLLVAIAYYGLVQLGDGLIEGGTLSVPLGVWLPDLAAGALALGLVVALARRPPFVLDARQRSWPRRLRSARRREPSVAGARSRGPHVRRRPLQRYVAGRFLELALAAFAILVAGYLLVDMLERLDFFARHTTSGAELVRYYAARIPLLASRIVPMALLLATALTASLLAVQNELNGMRGCGLAPARVLSVVLWLCLLIAPAAFVLGDQVVPRTESIAHEVKEEAVRGAEGPPGPSTAPEWYRVGQRLYEVERLDPLAGTARNLRVYEIGPDALPTQLIEARHASYIGNGVWRLRDASKVEVSDGALRRSPAPGLVELDERPPADVSTIRMSVAQLRALIREAGHAGLDTTPYRVDLWAKLAAPFACVVLPALALLFATGGPPYPTPALTLLVGFTLAVAYVLLTGIGTSLGYGRYLPPAVAGAAPVVLLALLAAWLSSRVPDLQRLR